MALFYSSPLIQNSKFNNFLWVCWFLGKNLSNFVPPAWKLNNPYYHNIQNRFFFLPFFCIVVILQLFEYTVGFKKQLISTTYCSFFANIYVIDSLFSMQYICLKLVLSSNMTHQNTYSRNSYFCFISKLVCHNVGLAIMNLLANFFNMRQFLITVAQWGQCNY